ncbi:diiron oxygenase [Mucilaginibacter sp. 14171R-50]|uniref:diiron oxygenase n=1 Tax=Mucilaginibacter sp. 14171R-50 TaxID=2703789 RepID=UPI00138CF165|nr:diiron oxygenase [Mucilaginibacter sp. 14171R-50]QHS56224.1 diiron oxygenase [Mucilaginibacter sp. 14171R-50]
MKADEIERLIKISKERPLMPETYVPWQEDPLQDDLYLPEALTSLHGLPVYDTLTPQQKKDLGRHEIVQVLYSYGWGEALFCVFMSRYALQLPTNSPEHRFLIREIIEEYRHQEMFAQAITRLKGAPLLQTAAHSFAGRVSTKYLPADYLFMGSLSVELITDVYGNHTRRAPEIYNVIRKVFELHNIEEGRHIHFTKGLLERYTAKAGYIKKTLYSFVILMNIYFVRTMYIRKEIYERIGLANPGAVFKQAQKNYRAKFTQNCLGQIIEFVDSWGGFNNATRWAWRWLLQAKV